MQELDDIALLREYAARDSEPAFATLVTRHIDRVYSVALRHTRNPHHAEEITQAVFVILATKAKHLRKDVILEGWLYQTARLTALTHIRSEIRRARREQEAYMQNVLNENDSEAWAQIAPLLDAALAGLNETDRNAVVLRFFYGKSMGEIGTALGANEDMARMRINRAIGKLQKFFSKRGVNSTSEAITGAISANSIQVAPAMLAKAVTATAFAKGATASVSTLTLIKGALKVMAWTKVKTAVVVGVGVLLAAGTTTVVTTTLVKNANPPSADAIYEKLWAMTTNSNTSLNSALSTFRKAPPTLIVRPTHYPAGGGGVWEIDGDKGVVACASVPLLIEIAYHYKQRRMVLPDTMPTGNYDLMETLPDGKNVAALKEEIKKQFGIVAHPEIRETNVWVLMVNDASKLRSHLSKEKSAGGFNGYIIDDKSKIVNLPVENAQLDDAAKGLGDVLGMPIVDHSGLTNRYDFNFQWKTTFTAERTKQSLRGQLLQFGLELKPGYEPVEMLIVEKVK